MRLSKNCFWIAAVNLALLVSPWAKPVLAKETTKTKVLIHMKTSLAEDDAQICAVPNVAWAAMNAGHEVTILVDGSAVTSITRGFGFLRGFFDSTTTALDRAPLPEREREALSEQLGVPLERVPKDYGKYFLFLKKKGIQIYVNQTMMRLYKINHESVKSIATPIPLMRMIELFTSSDRILVY